MMSDKWEPTTLSPSISSVEDFPARTYPSPESRQASKESDPGCGQSLPVSLASYDPDSSSWKTSQRSLVGGWIEYSGTWPRAGMMLSGIAYPLKPSAPITGGTASSSSGGPSTHRLWPTPTVSEAERQHGYQGSNGKAYATLTGAVGAAKVPDELRKKWPTPTARDWKDTGRPEMLANYAHKKRLACSVAASDTSKRGSLNPTWVEWLMGFPTGWTDLEDLETP